MNHKRQKTEHKYMEGFLGAFSVSDPMAVAECDALTSVRNEALAVRAHKDSFRLHFNSIPT